ncbi:cupin domain-containing protein [Rathayibacter toxicus]|uniref:Cupin domain-containing protein n=1 Tax=Rathayibacter toxicus TaxID=145458 RepID=A0A0C5BHB3_9MICO|nr:cupin domain-containing protein [Rathayibacter toxicus]AJM77600.1 hypothetical protein TI83_05925 [Rathayibacter toxicus]ALS56468.1 hypothetical protein APU90_00550 [Rathayibacter toxicus]KKM44575.1 hypothetical protein VT73_08515 [Rathayibacter toxicus]PPG21712.1 cupin domain-containing protein [Rathayibacter toxicus]PPG46674.1 cupin domain-containing protein [Rathayibacter toxicus]
MLVDHDQTDKYKDEYDVLVRRFSPILAKTADVKHSLGMAISRFEPGETVREHINKPHVEEMFIVLDGEVEVIIEEDKKILRSGDASFAEVGQRHRFSNVGTGTARLLSIWWRVKAETTD